nr:PREDICTED: centrosomal protein of 135 kDa-like isoform X5 [Bemisia tabaci]
MCCDTQKNLRYQKLRSQLNDLGYLQPLSKDSLLLVEHLLADYLHTSQKLKYYKETAHNSIQACRNLEISVEPYKSDNAKLVTQLNCLHNQILEEKTHFEERIHGLKLQVKKVEAERSDLEDLVSLQTNRIQVLEHESQLKNERLLQLQGLDLKPIITTAVGSKKRSAPLAKKKSFTRLEIDPGVESVKDWQTYYSEINRLNEDPVVVDLVILTEKRIESLQKTINDVEAEKQYLEEELELCATKISDRDVEIDRLQKLLGSGRPAEAVNREFYTEGTLEGASDMNANMDNCSNSTVNSKTLFLQQRLEEAIEKQHEAMCTAVRLADHNRLLEAQLKCAVESRCHCSTPPEDGTSERCKTDATEKTEHVQQNFLQCMTELNRRVDELMADNDSLRKCAEKGAEERKKLTNKVNELTAIENKLQQEITKLSRVNAAQKAKIVDFEERKAAFCRSCRKTSTEDLPKCSSVSKPTKTSPGKTYRKNDKVLHKVGSRAPKSLYNMAGNRRKSCADMNSLESKEDSESADQLGNLLASEEYRTGNGESTSLHDEVKKLIEEERRKYEEQIEFVRRQQAEHCARLHPPPYLISDKIKETINQAPSAVLELLLAEKNYYQKEYHRLLDKQLANEKDGVGDGNQGPTSKSSEKIIEQIQSEIQKSTNETLANLITKLNEKDKEIIDLKLSIEKLSSERGRGDYYNSQNLAELMAKLNEKDKEIMDLKYSIQKSSLEKGKGDYLDTQNALIRSLELERDLAKREVKRLEEEKAALWSQLSNIREGHRLGENRMSQLSIDFEDRLRKLESERCELLNKQTSQTLIIENFEREIDQYRKSLVQSQQDLTEQKALYNHMKLAHEQAERALRDCHSNQGHLNKELSANLDRIQALESEVTTLDRELQNVKIERNTLRTNLKQLDQQKDFLLCKLDDKTERIASMEKEIMKNETVLRQYETTIAELHAKYNLALNDSSKTEESVRRAHNELENLHKQIRELETSKENLLSENKRIMNDLTTITREYTSMRSELERSKREVQDLKQQLQSYVDCVKRYEDELARKDHERLEMLEQFRNLSEETAALEQTNLLVESEAKSTQSSLREAESKVEELQRFIEDKERKIKTYHEELNELRFQLSHLEMETSSLREEKSKMENDLYASRDLSTTVLSKNDHLLEQMNALTAHKTAMEAEIAVLKESMNDISKKYRESNRDMQAMHDQISSYEKELSMEVEVNDKLKHEVAALTEQLNQLEAQLRMKSTELERIEKESADNNQEISQLRREMISARYEQTRSDEARRECPVIPPYTFSKIVYCEACVPSNSPDSSKTKQMDLKSFSSTINIADSKASDVSIEKPCTHLPYTSSSPQSCNAWNQKSFHLSCI